MLTWFNPLLKEIIFQKICVMSVLQLSANHICVILKAYSLHSEYQGYQTNLFFILPDLDAKVKVTEHL